MGVISGMHERRSHQKPALRRGFERYPVWRRAAGRPGPAQMTRKGPDQADGAYRDRTGDLRLAKPARRGIPVNYGETAGAKSAPLEAGGSPQGRHGRSPQIDTSGVQ